MARKRKPPRVTSTRRQPTTRGGPRVTSRTQQPTTGRGRIVRSPGSPWVARGTLAGMHRPPGGAAGGPAAGASAAPAAPAGPQYSVANLPPDASYEQIVAQLQRQRDEGIAAIAGERVRGLTEYGFQEGPNGVLTFDVNNPLSKASLLKQAYDTNRRSTGNQTAQTGQLYAGARQNALDLVSRNQLQAQDAQQRALQAFLAGNTGRRKEALTNYELAVGQAQGDRVGRFESNPLYQPSAENPETPAAAAQAAAARGPAAAAKPKRKPRFRPFQPSWRR